MRKREIFILQLFVEILLHVRCTNSTVNIPVFSLMASDSMKKKNSDYI